MNHPELDELLGLVRGDEVSEDVRGHVGRCVQCADDVASVARLGAAADAIGPTLAPNSLAAPPSSVWDRIQAELVPEPPVVLAVPTVQRRSRRRSMALVAAAVVAGAVGGGVVGYVLADDATQAPDRPIAVGSLTPEGQNVISGQAELTQHDSSRSLTVTLSASVDGPGYVEAWLLDPETDEMLGLGVLGPAGGTVTVPSDADLSRFTTVDVSREPFDGDPTHSADSIARGVLDRV